MTKWQPIETAPKDGTTVLLFFPETYWMTGEHVSVGFWDAEENDERADFYASEAASQGMSAFGDSPTHWQPLPAPPEGEL